MIQACFLYLHYVMIQICNKKYIKYYIVYIVLVNVFILKKYIALNDDVPITLMLMLLIDKI